MVVVVISSSSTSFIITNIITIGVVRLSARVCSWTARQFSAEASERATIIIIIII